MIGAMFIATWLFVGLLTVILAGFIDRIAGAKPDEKDGDAVLIVMILAPVMFPITLGVLIYRLILTKGKK
jgi:hypothetical protein